MGNDLLKICRDCGNINLLGEDNWFSKEQNQKRYNSLMRVYKGKLTQDYCPFCLVQNIQNLNDNFRSMNGN